MEEPASIKLKKRLRELRQNRGWTQEHAAEVCGIGQKLYQLYELGIKDNPGLRTLEKLARGYGLEIHELLGPVMPRPRTRLSGRKQQRKKRTKS